VVTSKRALYHDLCGNFEHYSAIFRPIFGRFSAVFRPILSLYLKELQNIDQTQAKTSKNTAGKRPELWRVVGDLQF